MNTDLTGGNPSKPFPIEDNYVRDASRHDGMGEPEPEMTRPNVSIGQEKYAKRAGTKSIYKDVTRNTADDNAASAKAESSTCYEVEGEGRDYEK